MMMTELILKYLAAKSEVKIPGFGTFLQKDAPAFYDEKSGALLPPGKELFFDVDFDLKNDDLVRFVADQNNITSKESLAKIEELTNYWKSTLEKNNELKLPQFGDFFINDNHLLFRGKHFTVENPENFGLEEVNLTQLKTGNNYDKSDSDRNYKTDNSKLWWLFLLIPIAAIIYFAIQKPELIFGKKSFQNLNKIKTVSTSKKDKQMKETIKTDSISLKNNADAKK